MDIKTELTVGDTLVPLVFMSDGTHLLNFAGDQKVLPLYMTIGNLSSKIHQMPSTHSIIMIALLPIPIKNCNILQIQPDEQRQTNRDVMKQVLRQELQPLTFIQNTSTESGYYNVLCADGNFRHCKPVLAASLADCPGYSGLHHLKQNVCFRSECTKNELGDDVPPDKQHPRRDHILYRMLRNANTRAADTKLSSRQVHRGINVFRHIPLILRNLPKPNLLHTLQVGMLDHLQKQIIHFMKIHEWLDKTNAIRLSVPAYHNLMPKYKSYEEVSQWNGKQMKEISRYLLGVVTQSPRGRCRAQCLTFNHATECTRALLEFYMHARYTSHSDATFSYMDDASQHFHTFKDVFLHVQAGKKA